MLCSKITMQRTRERWKREGEREIGSSQVEGGEELAVQGTWADKAPVTCDIPFQEMEIRTVKRNRRWNYRHIHPEDWWGKKIQTDNRIKCCWAKDFVPLRTRERKREPSFRLVPECPQHLGLSWPWSQEPQVPNQRSNHTLIPRCTFAGRWDQVQTQDSQTRSTALTTRSNDTPFFRILSGTECPQKITGK